MSHTIAQNVTDLSPAQERAAELLALGMTVTAVAKEVGRARETVSSWQGQPAFQAAMKQQLQTARETARARLLALVDPALAALEADLTNPDVPRAVRQKAALAVLDRTGHGSTKGLEVEVSGGEMPLRLEKLSREKRIELWKRLSKGEGPPPPS